MALPNAASASLGCQHLSTPKPFRERTPALSAPINIHFTTIYNRVESEWAFMCQLAVQFDSQF